jgi:CMP/dCMP deaminase zinc-binding
MERKVSNEDKNIIKDDMFFMKEALKEAKKAYNKNEVPVGVVLVKNGEIVSKGHNNKENKSDPMGHAEIITINKYCKKYNTWRLNDITMYVTLEPCLMCSSILQQVRIGKVVMAASDPKTGAMGSIIDINEIKSNHKINIEKGILLEESEKMLKTFFKKLRDEKKRKK